MLDWTRLSKQIFGILIPWTRVGKEARIDRQRWLAVRYYATGRYDACRSALERANQIAESFGEGEALAVHLERTGEFHESVGSFADAEPQYLRAMEIRERIHGQDGSGLAPSLNSLALLYYAEGRYAEAEQLYQRLIPIIERHIGSETRELAVALDNFAAVLRRMKRTDEAAPLAERAKSIRVRLKEAKGQAKG